MKQKIKKLLRFFARRLVDVRLMPRVIILNCDGGICSQMHFRLVGELLERRGQKVLYNIDWFAYNGMDDDKRFCRNFDLLKIFPDLHFPIARNKWLKRIYNSVLYHKNNYYDLNDPYGWLNLKAPMLLDGYFRDPEEMFGPIFDELFSPDLSVLKAENRSMLEKIEDYERGGGACAMHVRRGDLAKFNPAYGNPTPLTYFIDSYTRIKDLHPDTHFFIFSDEPEWCRENVLPALGKDVEICDINGSDRGYCDLILMSRCRHLIASQGSMARYAARLRPAGRRNGTVIIPERF